MLEWVSSLSLYAWICRWLSIHWLHNCCLLTSHPICIGTDTLRRQKEVARPLIAGGKGGCKPCELGPLEKTRSFCQHRAIYLSPYQSFWGRLDENVSHMLRYLNTCFHVDGFVVGGYEEVQPCWRKCVPENSLESLIPLPACYVLHGFCWRCEISTYSSCFHTCHLLPWLPRPSTLQAKINSFFSKLH